MTAIMVMVAALNRAFSIAIIEFRGVISNEESETVRSDVMNEGQAEKT